MLLSTEDKSVYLIKSMFAIYKDSISVYLRKSMLLSTEDSISFYSVTILKSINLYPLLKEVGQFLSTEEEITSTSDFKTKSNLP